MTEDLHELIRRKLIGWPTLAVGLDKGWLTKDALSDYALTRLCDGGDDNDIALLAGSTDLSDEEVSGLLATLCQKEGVDLKNEQPQALEKWRLVMLSSLQRSALSAEDKLEQLQELYAAFGYPADMASCSIYAQDGIDPLNALQNVISDLEQRFT